ncbi:autotransporter outer membrane beta-barrel domain-containing protein [Sphingomonas jaspsi]|uniref:autotransporter outer membrane beta-barrel domain-containing protein n=1 Tax=Sphingomonas jaspsi TaxID=392409 RepID=UPI0004BA37CC|nr:autotransporter outer membrane beta-barrel domain-containing protein [Sphingomonas jaspsi]
MRRLLLASTCAVAVAAPAFAETKIQTATTAPVRTSTVNAGNPDAITITSAGTITATSPTAVTIDSNHVVQNQGGIAISNINGATGILANAGVTSGINNSGTIKVDEPYTPTDTDNDGDLDGPFALGSGRFGIHTLGAFTGNIVNTGTITVEGNNSGGIVLGGPLTGNFTHDGTTSVLGNNSVGVSLDDVTGKVRLAGNISAQGQNSIAVQSLGDVTGAMVIQGKISATGYRYTTAPADPSKLDADDLLQGGPAISIEGNVTQGVILAVPPKDTSPTNNDEDGDGIDDSKEGSAAVASYGSAAALRIGSTSQTVTLGPVPGTSTSFGLIVDGSVLGTGVYSGVDGNAIQIGGMGNSVTIANGVGINGKVQALSLDRAATAIRLGSGANTGELRNAGEIGASSGNTANSVATAVAIDAGASLPTIRNSGKIGATVSGSNGTAIAIIDRSGTTTLVENSGQISATGGGAGKNVAIDLSANTTGATIRQTVVAATFAAPTITGDVKFGSGNDLLDLGDGKLTGNVTMGGGNNRYLLSGDTVAAGNVSFGSGNDQLSLAGTSTFTGNADFGGGTDSLSIAGTSVFTGQLANSAGLAVNVSGGKFNLVKAATVSSLNVTGGGTFGVTLDKTAGNASALTVTGTANFDPNSKLQLSVVNIGQAEGTYTVLTAGTLTGAGNLATNTDLLPFLYKGTLAVTGNQLNVTIARKSAVDLGLNASETAAYPAIYAALAKDNAIGNSILAIRSGDEFIANVRQMLPDHAGGTFEAATAGDRAAARVLADPSAPYKQDGKVGYWISQFAWGSSKDLGSTAGFKVGGWGASGGAELKTGMGRFGLGLNYIYGKDGDRATDNEVRLNQIGLAAHWRFVKDGFQASVRGGWSHVSFDGTRYFSSDATGTLVERTMESKWKGSLVSATGNVSHQFWTGNLYIRPGATVEYYRLTEKGHHESGGGDALDLTVNSRKSDELAVNGLLAVGMEFGPEYKDSGYFALEAEFGRRQIVGGALGDTVAHFNGGSDFTLTPEDRESGWLARLRAIGGGPGMRFIGELGGEQREGRAAINVRVGLAFGL